MAKQKTKKAAVKRFTKSSTGKLRHRTIGQAHFNARDNGKSTRNKHHDRAVSPSDASRLAAILPYV